MNEYLVYCIQSSRSPGRTYVGCTNNFKRRLRQHNGEITGGARSTRSEKMRPWRPVFHVTGLNKREALQLEWALKHKRVSGASGVTGRKRTLAHVMRLPRWCTRATPTHEIVHRIKIKLF